MNTLDLKKLMAERGLTNVQVREWVRKRLKDGSIWSRLNPDLLCGEELLPCMMVDSPPLSSAALVPFPVAVQRIKSLDPAAPDYRELLAQEKILWCSRSGHRAGPAVVRRVVKQLDYYNLEPTSGRNFYWIEPSPQISSYWSLLDMVLPALDNYSILEPGLPQPPVDQPGEAWQSANDDYGASLRFSAQVESEDSLVMAAALLGKKTYWLRNYRLNPDRYSFIRQQLFYLLGDRLVPWRPGDLPKQSSYRGMVYRKPKQK